jgi:tetratricopeptide (TPR) repeat protein
VFEQLVRALTAQRKSAEVQALIEAELLPVRALQPNGAPPATARLGVVLRHAALALHAAKDPLQARPLAEEAWNLYEQHPDWPEGERSHAFQVLETVLTELGDHAALESVQRRLVEKLRGKLQPGDPALAGELAKLAMNLLAQQKFAEAEAPAREALATREKAAPNDWRTFNSRSQLGGSLLGQEKYAEAEPLLLAGYEGMKQREASIPQPGKVRLHETLQRLVLLYEEKGEADKATEWKKKLSEYEIASGVTVRTGTNK